MNQIVPEVLQEFENNNTPIKNQFAKAGSKNRNFEFSVRKEYIRNKQLYEEVKLHAYFKEKLTVPSFLV